MKKTLFSITSLVLMLGSTNTHAALSYVLDGSNQMLMGINDLVTLNGKHYDVVFGDGSPATLWPSDQFGFANTSEASLARTALVSAFQISGFTSTNLPLGINGVPNTYTQALNISFPVADLGGGFYNIYGVSSTTIGDPFPNFFGITQSTFLNDYSVAPNITWAKFTDVTPSASVPEPQSYIMIFSGLGLIGAMARRKKESTN